MSRTLGLACALAWGLGLHGLPIAAAEMYAGVSPVTAAGTPGSLLRIDDATGVAAVLGDPVTPGGISGLDFDSTGRLFASTRDGNTQPSFLVEIDPNAGTLLHTVGKIVTATGQTVGISDLAFQPGTDTLYATSANNAPCIFCVYTINTTTAVATLVGNPGIANGGLAFGPDPNNASGSLLYLVESGASPTLTVLDPSNASVVSQQPLRFASGQIFEGSPVGGNEAPLDGLGSRRSDGALFATGAAGALAVVTVGLDGQVRFLSENVGAKPTDIAFKPPICPGGDDSLDADHDGVPDFCDVCASSNDVLDADGDGVPDGCDICAAGDDSIDGDGDTVPDACDVCALGDDALDADGDGVPNACDPCATDPHNDADGDGVCGDSDVCPGGSDALDTDGDVTPDFCDVCPLDSQNDADNDGICESEDDCPLISNSDQVDLDGDGVGDVCDPDLDGDGALNAEDNCIYDPNPSQADVDHDGLGDACDPVVDDADADGVADGVDACLGTPSGAAVDASGCSISQLCPCQHSQSGDKWKNHGGYVSCVAHTAEDFVEADFMTEAEKDATVSQAGASRCGAK